MIQDQKTQVQLDPNDIVQGVIRQRDTYANLVVQLEAVIAAKDREIAALKADAAEGNAREAQTVQAAE